MPALWTEIGLKRRHRAHTRVSVNARKKMPISKIRADFECFDDKGDGGDGKAMIKILGGCRLRGRPSSRWLDSVMRTMRICLPAKEYRSSRGILVPMYFYLSEKRAKSLTVTQASYAAQEYHEISHG